MKNLNKIFILSMFILTIFSIGNVSATWTKMIGAQCGTNEWTNFLCPDGHVWYDATFGYSCDIGEYVACANTCDYTLKKCTGGVIPANCNEGWEQCGSGKTSDENGDVYRCSNGQLSLYQSCGNNKCLETGTYAQCQEKRYYCLGQLDCYWSTVKGNSCYDTVEQCRANLGGGSGSGSGSGSGGGGGGTSFDWSTLLIIGAIIFVILGVYKYLTSK